MRKHRLVVLCFVLLVGLGLVSYAAAGAKSKAAASGSIAIALGNEPTTLDPLLQEDGNERWVTDSIYDTLMGRSPDGKTLYPKLAAAQPKLVNPTTWRFTLRPGIKFSDGEPMNADAVVATITKIIDPKYNSAQIEFVGTVKGARKVNDLTVDILTKGPDPILPSRMYWVRIIPPHPTVDLASHPIGTGPYLFKEWDRGNQIVLTANPDYWGTPKASIQTITYKFVPDEGAQLAGLVSGQYDLITHLLPDDTKRAPKAVVTNGNEHPMLILNAKPGKQLTANVKVRQALNYAVDKNALAQKLFLGYATPDQGQTLSPSWFGYNPSVKAYPYDPAKAKALLKAAGAVGKTINIDTEAGRWLNDKVMVEAVAQYWRAVGLKVNVRVHDFNTYLNKYLFNSKQRPDAVFVSTDNPLYDADRTVSAYYASTGTGASNSDKLIQKWIDQARTTTNVQKRLALYHQAVKRAHDQAIIVWLLNTKNVWGMSKRLSWQPRLDGFMFDNTMRLTG
ncbi:MAG TPA: ABC transporter substrate-binding protein [Gaiellaceae bacterium]|nr:ABC transporter substrate-binding protein [Gaiellaceae bacterium]